MTDALTWKPAWEIRDLIAKREVSCLEVTEHFLGRIEELNPTLRAFAEVDAEGARSQAKRAAEAVADGDDLGPLHGIPTSVKSPIRVEGMRLEEFGQSKPAMLLTASYGPLARNVRDAALVTQAIGGPDGRDDVCVQDDPRNCVAPLDAGVEGMRLAWTDGFGFASLYAGEENARGTGSGSAGSSATTTSSCR